MKKIFRNIKKCDKGAFFSPLSLVLVVTPLLLSSCRHKDLVYDHPDSGHINVVFDWRNAPSANPSSMAFYLYDPDGENPIRYIFQNNYGGTIRVPASEYDAICLNADLTDWAVINRKEAIDNYEVTTLEENVLPASGFSTRAVPRAESSEEEKITATPGFLWAARTNSIQIPAGTENKTIIMYPQEKICHYVVDIYDSGDVSRYSASGIDGTLSGMSEGYLIGKDIAHSTKVTHPFLLRPVKSSNSLHAEFLTFGETPDSGEHHLSIYMIRDDGKKWNCNVDVTNQVKNASDPRHVHIVVRGLDLPNPIGGGGGIIPDVDEWITVNINMKM